MKCLSYTIGGWHAEAQLEQIDPGKLMAIIMLTSTKGGTGTSRHTIVFDHADGSDSSAETEAVVRRLLRARYDV